jgi:SAM-dependent methyltransferase
MTDRRLDAVERFYDFHPINAKQILDAVAARGIAPGAITEAVLQQHDQDHYGGTAATDRLIAEAAVRAEDVVLDVCCGMGGPARYLAWKTGCDVTGLDLTASRVEGAIELTRVAGLSNSVRFVHRILVERHAMYRSLEAQTIARLGREHFERYDRAYEHFVELYRSGVLTGALIHAVKAQ